MPLTISTVLTIVLILLGSTILFFTVFGTELLKIKGKEKLEQVRKKFITLWLLAGVIFLAAAFSIIVFYGDKSSNKWTKEQKEDMIKKIMESSIFMHGTGQDTARLVSECFIEKYTAIYTPAQMKQQNKLSNEELSKLTSGMMLECLKKYGLPKIDTSNTDDPHKGSQIKQMSL